MKFNLKLLISLIFLFFLIGLFNAQEISSGIISSDQVTTITEELDGDFIYDEIKSVYEISSSALEQGVSKTLEQKDAFRININANNYYILLWNISDEEVLVVFPGKRNLIFGVNDLILIDIDQDNQLDIQLKLKSIKSSYETSTTSVSVELGEESATVKNIEQIPKKEAEIYIQKFIEEERIPEGDYFELFDVEISLLDYVIYHPSDLNALIKFKNFGDAPSKINIIYSIINENGEEIYQGIDTKVVETEESLIKNFGFLNIKTGRYTLISNISYGKNQTADSRIGFEIIKGSPWEIIFGPLVFILIIVISAISLIFFIKRNKRYKTQQKKDLNVIKKLKKV